jgi:hypothetical protein
MSDNEPTDDAAFFGDKVWVYCGSHLRPHLTGWCSVGLDMKVMLSAQSETEAYRQCERLELRLYRGQR